MDLRKVVLPPCKIEAELEHIEAPGLQKKMGQAIAAGPGGQLQEDRFAIPDDEIDHTDGTVDPEASRTFPEHLRKGLPADLPGQIIAQDIPVDGPEGACSGRGSSGSGGSALSGPRR